MSQNSLTPKFFFLSLGVLVTLITSVVSFLNLLFGVLNKHFPDALNAVYQYGYSSWDYDGIRASLATLIIVFPVFFVLAYFWNKESKKELGTGDAIIKKWMVYIVLFLTAIVVIVDLVTLVKYFVAGEITTRFIIKVLLVLAVAKIVGLYYLYVLGSLNRFKKIISISSTIVAPVFVIAAIIISFCVIGSPSEQRAWRMDERRIQDLQSLQWQVISYWQQKESLPINIKELSNPLSGFSLPVDPEFTKGLTYEYEKNNDMQFSLCATFSAEMPQGWQEYSGGGGVMPMFSEGRDMAVSSYPSMGGTNESWDHDAGRTCFERTIDPELYPPYSKG
ncbi:MAG: DUF5671 domain-containing protein [Candidatus Pacebacteria bacterium]|nr:DUF5671 domain-containing protein [Candidatus Paceibacterota bacterium]